MATLRFNAVTSYHVVSAEFIHLRVDAAFAARIFRSGLVPTSDPHRHEGRVGFDVAPAGGELSLHVAPEHQPNVTVGADGVLEVTESMLQRVGIRVRINLAGDEWHRPTVQARAQTLLSGFGSRTSVFAEPNGLTSHKVELLGLREPSVRVVDDHTLEVVIGGPANGGGLYDVTTVDDFFFRLPLRDFTSTLVMPQPRDVPLRVVATPVWVSIKFDPVAVSTNINWPRRRLEAPDFLNVMAGFLNTQPGAIVLHPEDDGRVQQTDTDSRLRFAFRQLVADVDARTADELMTTLFAVNRTTLNTHFSSTLLWLEADGEPITFAPTTESPLAAAAEASLSSKVSAGMWFGLLVAIVTVASGFLYVASVRRHKDMPVGVMSGRSKGAQNSIQTLHPGTSLLAGDENQGLVLDERKHVGSQRAAAEKGRKRQAMLDAQNGRRVDPALLEERPTEFAPMGEGQTLRKYVRSNLLRAREMEHDQRDLGRMPKQMARPLVFGGGAVGAADSDDDEFAATRDDGPRPAPTNPLARR